MHGAEGNVAFDILERSGKGKCVAAYEVADLYALIAYAVMKFIMTMKTSVVELYFGLRTGSAICIQCCLESSFKFRRLVAQLRTGYQCFQSGQFGKISTLTSALERVHQT